MLNQLILILIVALVSVVNAQPSLFSLPMPVASITPAPVATNRGAFTAFWSHPTNTSDIAAYRLAWGTNAALLNNSTQVGKSITNVTVGGLVELRTYYLSLVSVGTNGLESLPATNSHFTQPNFQSGSYVTHFTVPCPAGRTNLIQSSTNGVTWRTILTNTAGGNVTLLRTNSAIAPGMMEFFRLR